MADSSLLLDEFFESGDDRFLAQILGHSAPGKLKSLADRWLADPRPFARRALLGYIDDGCDRAGHRPLVKKLLKGCEAKGDVEAMAHFLVAFDRLAPRKLVTFRGWDYASRSHYDIQQLRFDKKLPRHAPREKAYRFGQPDPKTPEGWPVYLPGGRFSLYTRHYLRRRAWRFFRKLGYRDAKQYGAAIRSALALYKDEHLARTEQLVDAWGLMHALYWGSPVIERRPRGIVVAKARTLKELSPAPIHPEAWEGCLDEIFELFLRAHSRTVRTFCLQLLKRDYAEQLKQLPLARVRALLKSANPDVHGFGAELLKNAQGLESLPISEWMEFLKLEDPVALTAICEAVARHVTPDRLTLAQCVELACARPAPVAELGLKWAKSKPVRGFELPVLMGLAKAEAKTVREQAVDWLVQLLALNEKDARPELVRELIDSKHADVRERAMKLVGDQPVLWQAMSESPYDDVRTRLVESLGEREKTFAPEALHRVWASAILAVHRGGRAKRQVANQIATRIVKTPGESQQLLPLLGYALRSVRAAERRTALASLARAAYQQPSLRAAIEKQLPELKFSDAEVAR